MKDTVLIKWASIKGKASPPRKATEGSVGYDLMCTELYTSRDNMEMNSITIGTDIAVEIPKGYCGKLFARSSIDKRPMFLSNGVGLIDSDYRGEIKGNFKLTNTATMYNNIDKLYNIGDYCVQLVIEKVEPVEFIQVGINDLSKTARDHGGFGSTGE